ncbi:NAD(P)H-hydrate dehydratase [Herbiconiux sp. L3-i23]|uniref:NAD(P)H-hydrate dehydratase n=1 Tax=Herbiconiux sp. L3-i23 TaxID=2905871 RepID=UPI002063F51D|nr:NAD(P)H-hydrate dehydratase [Herbiconiux sp. L3-i23]BDI22439.1 ADP-dependent (S)-NAD(P)H-hydrate dehydratase [Herbiconiux sp. L3-i23]
MIRTPETVTAALLRGRPLPEPGGSKRDRGDVLIVGGARKTPGAAALAGLAALRVGAGRLTIGVAVSSAPALAVSFPEAGVIDLEETEGGSVSASSIDRLRDSADTDCVLFGPGLDDIDETQALLAALVPAVGDETRVVLDAFALGALARDPGVVDGLRGRILLTPNETEAALLLDRDVDDLERDIPEIAERYGAVVTCHGVIADQDGGLWRVEDGGPGLGTSGSGDVLAGALAGLTGRGADPATAALWASYLHAQAGDRLAQRMGPLGFLARELLDELPSLLATLS